MREKPNIPTASASAGDADLKPALATRETAGPFSSYDPVILPPRYRPKRNENSYLHQNLDTNAYSSSIPGNRSPGTI